MALVLETGEGSATAESFVTLAEVRAFAVSRGKVVSAVDATLEAQIRTAHDYLLAKEPQFQGIRAKESQALPFPRTGVVLYNYLVASNVVPTPVKNAICQLVIEQLARELLPASPGRVVQSESVGPISTTYESSGTTSATPALPRVDIYLQPLFRSGGALRGERA